MFRNFLGKNQENILLAGRKDKTESATGGGRRAREETGKRYQMTALRFQTGGRH